MSDDEVKAIELENTFKPKFKDLEAEKVFDALHLRNTGKLIETLEEFDGDISELRTQIRSYLATEEALSENEDAESVFEGSLASIIDDEEDREKLKKALGGSKAETLVKPKSEPESSESSSDGNLSQVDRAIQLAEDHSRFFSDERGKGFASVTFRGEREIIPVSGRRFKQLIGHIFWLEESENLGTEQINTVVNNLEGRAVFDGEEIELHNRTAWKENALWYDLDGNIAVKITEKGWDVEEPPILFRGYQHQKPQIEPETDQNVELDRIFDFLNPCLTDDQRLLFKVQLVSSFIPGFPHPIICPHGPQGSAKTFMHKIMRRLVDPSEIETLQYSTNLTQLTQKLDHHWFVPFDNITYLPQKVSDFFCRAVTGQGFSKRELYTDDSDIIYSFQRPVGLNGINTVPTKPDLLDRTILYELERIPKDKRKSEDEILTEFEQRKPGILASIFEILSDTLEIKPEIDLDWKPRMADFAEWGEAISQAMGYSEYEFMRAYQDNIESSNVEAIEAHIIGEAVLKLMEDRSEWNGTPSETLEKLNEIAEEENINTDQKKWPGGPQWVKRRLNEVKANLQEAGLEISYPREGDAGTRKILLEWKDDVSDVSNDRTDDTDTTDSSSNNLSEEVVNFLEENGMSSYQEVIENTELDEKEAEQVITRLLDDGIIFEPKPGKLQKL